MKRIIIKTDDEILAAKKLDTKNMGDVVIRNDNGVNLIFHANKKKISELRRLEKMQMVRTPNPYTATLVRTGEWCIKAHFHLLIPLYPKIPNTIP